MKPPIINNKRMKATLEQLEHSICEGLISSSPVNCGGTNKFHRNVIIEHTPDISFISGLAATGLRGSALINCSELTVNLGQITDAARKKIPIIIHAKTSLDSEPLSNQQHINSVANAGCFQLVAVTPSELGHLTLIAHRIAELSLIPGIVINATGSYDIELPNDSIIQSYLGNPDEKLASPTPSQEMIFGASRRKIPNWFNFDSPVSIGVFKSDSDQAMEAAASQRFFYNHLPELMNQAFSEYNQLAGTQINPVDQSGSGSYMLITTGIGLDQEAINLQHEQVQFVRLRQLQPLPKLPSLEGVTVTLLESNSHTGNESLLKHELQRTVPKSNLYCANYTGVLNVENVGHAIQHMLSGKQLQSYHLGIGFTKDGSNYPKHDILLQHIKKEYPGIENEAVREHKNAPTPVNEKRELPLAIKRYSDHGPVYSRLSRFYNDNAFFYQIGDTDELVADPFSAIPVMPSATASFRDFEKDRQQLPLFNPINCTGCGDCFVSCPHSAMPPISIGFESLIKGGAEIATQNGQAISKLTPMIKNLGKLAAKHAIAEEIKDIGSILKPAFEDLVTQTKLEGDKLEEASREFNSVLESVQDLPAAITDTFFNKPNQQDQGSGELFSINIDPHACTGCGICIRACQEKALTITDQTEELIEQLETKFKLWEQLPDTSGGTINRLYHDAEYPSVAAMMLSRSYYMTMTSGSLLRDDASYKALLHIITATTESVVQPKIIEQLKAIDDLIASLTNNIHDKLSGALPKDNLDKLSKSLQNFQGNSATIQDIVDQVAEHEQGKIIDTSNLKRKTQLVEELENLKWVLTEGPTGTGRSRYGMLVSGKESMEWSRDYPYNNFTTPTVIHWTGSAPEHCLGLFHGQLRYLLDHAKLIRRATLESKNKYDPNKHDQEIANLDWSQLDENEKCRITPILLIAERADLNQLGWNSLNKVLAGNWPVKVFILDNAIVNPTENPTAAQAQTTSGLFSTMSLKNAFVFQGGMGNLDNLFDGLLDGLGKPNPALFSLYTTKTINHTNQNTDSFSLASLALKSRAIPALKYDPSGQSHFLSGAMDMSGNESKNMDWHSEEIVIDDETTINYTITWADWAFTLNAWQSHFTQSEDNDLNTPISEYIQMEEKSRADRIPVVIRMIDGDLTYFRTTEQVVAATEAALLHWNTLQEVAGLLTEFPLKLREEVAKELEVKYENEVKQLKSEHQKQLQEQELQNMEIVRQRLKAKLVALSKMKN